jgi:UDP-N-acetyl-D-mannosaminuronate dehydrogenase
MDPTDAIPLIDKFRTREAHVAIIGLGYVGLPLAVAFAEAGFRVIGIDMNEGRVANLNTGQSYIADIPSERLAAVLTRNRVKSQRASNPSADATNSTDPINSIDAINPTDAIAAIDPILRKLSGWTRNTITTGHYEGSGSK